MRGGCRGQVSNEAALEASTPTAPVAAKRLCDLLMTFPGAAIGGVEWRVLLDMYEERYAGRLDLAALGYPGALSAATTLLSDVLRVVDTEDVDNPVVAVEDGVAQTPQPGLLGSWPSLYQVICSVVLEYGSQSCSQVMELPLCQLRPLLEKHWHADFHECSMSFRSDEGSFIRLKKMKHLLQAVLKWGEQRRTWQQARQLRGLGGTAVDVVLHQVLELVPSTKLNDLVLRCFTSPQAPSPSAAGKEVPVVSMSSSRCARKGEASSGLRSEVERLRAENDKLRARNQKLAGGSTPPTPQMQKISRSSSGDESQLDLQLDLPENLWDNLPENLFDNPFEPPPMNFYRYDMACASPSASGTASTMTPSQASSCSEAMQSNFTYMPVWYPFMQAVNGCVVDVSVIPSGIVKSACQHFDREGPPLLPSSNLL